MARIFLIVAAVSGFLSIALGAFAAHGLADVVSPSRLQVFQTGAEYQMTQTLALVAVSVLLNRTPNSKILLLSGWSFVAGFLLFSGSLYFLVLLDMPVLGMITPIGGVAFLLGWTGLFIHGWRNYRAS